MKNAVIVILLVAAVALGAFAFHQKNQISQLNTDNTALKQQLDAKTAEVEDARMAEHKAKVLQSALDESAAEANAKTLKVAELQQKLDTMPTNAPDAAPAKSTNGMAAFAAMFKDPKMKEMIKTQQKAVMGPMIEKQYAALFKQLNMSPEDAAKMKDLLTQKMLAGADIGMSMMDDSLDASQRADLGKQVKAEMDGFDNQIKDFLGDSNYSAYKTYEKSAPDRMTVGQFSDQLASGANPLSADQQEQLTQAMNDARTSFKWTTDYTDQSKIPDNGDFSAMFTEDKVNQFFTEKEQFDQQFLTRAQQILTPDQLKSFEEFQKNQRDLQAMGMKMAASMFGSKK
jgi:hypothetical protein